MTTSGRQGRAKRDPNYIFLGSAAPHVNAVQEVFGFWGDHKITKVRIKSVDREAVAGTAYTELEDCCDEDDRFYELDFHGILHDGYIRSIVLEAEREHNPEK